jgi:hypothetical protein
VFYNDDKNLQTFTSGNAANPGIVFAIVNAGSARTYGAEATFSYMVSSAIDVGVNVGYLNAKYQNFANSDGSVLNTFDFSDKTMLFSPEWQLSFTGNLDQPISDKVNAIGSFLASYTSDVKFFNSSPPRRARSDPEGLLAGQRPAWRRHGPQALRTRSVRQQPVRPGLLHLGQRGRLRAATALGRSAGRRGRVPASLQMIANPLARASGIGQIQPKRRDMR